MGKLKRPLKKNHLTPGITRRAVNMEDNIQANLRDRCEPLLGARCIYKAAQL